MSLFRRILELKTGPVQYELSRRDHMKMVGHPFPYSIKQDEFEYLTDLIVTHKLTRGFECATAFGISTCAIAEGFRRTNGQLITLDSYIEEEVKDPESYRIGKQDRVYEQAMGYQSVMYLRSALGLDRHLSPEVGWSPQDVGTVIRKHFGDAKLDFVFLDAGHFPEQMIRDIAAFVPFLGPRYVLVFHDNYPRSFAPEVHQFLRDQVGQDCEIVVPHPRGENLSVVIHV